MKIAVVCAPGIGDLVIMHIASYHLSKAGHDVTTISAHQFGQWVKGYKFEADLSLHFDAIFLQHDNKEKSFEIREQKNLVYTFFGAHNTTKHGSLRQGFDYVCNLNLSMVDNVVIALRDLFQIHASKENGFTPPTGLIHRKNRKRIIIHDTSADPKRNWPRFHQVLPFLESCQLKPVFLPQFPTLENLASFIYESGYFLGNDSGPGHIASLLKIPHLIIGKDEKHLRHWRPGWGYGEVITPSKWIPNFKPFRLREKKWKSFISKRSVIKILKNKILVN